MVGIFYASLSLKNRIILVQEINAEFPLILIGPMKK
jgi:hypothetical protein